MSESAFPTDLLSSLASNPDLLKNAMQMASALASSGALDGLLGKRGEQDTPVSQSGKDFSSLLSGIGQGKREDQPKNASTDRTHPPSPEPRPPMKRPEPPCHNDRIQLLRAVRPFLPEEKREKIDFLVQLLGLLHTAEELGLRKLF